ncbi:Uncharacterized membrane protein [Cribrihabitans marinus]|uniref:Uncharacterized membrane protein n=1 Tax=Cribrihabitans marinus TaxID=1227549 RepID=A0A1H7BIW5_9RHOB|nr:DUF2339 domain-containing protein [Cribrihabitans marinus]GGH34511.1 hypothetical protein GCM10010973_27280 [Cribrihabitans marinus]SEJ76844.1 Uncharacterized membrane protein [Cribrihabitans marinus]
MDAFIALALLVVLAIPILLVALLVGQVRLRRRVADLERRLSDARTSDAAAPSKDGPWSAPADTPAPVAAETGPAAPPRAEDPPAAAVIAARKAQGAAVSNEAPPRAFVFRADRLSGLAAWLRENWFYAVSALSLALAGIFLVQYGVENGLLPPVARVAAALGFGAALIVAGEVIRRRFGDGEDRATAYLPSVFSGAGLVTLFGGVLSARLLYGLIGPEAALIGMVGVALAGLVLGWFHGPLLAAVALIGAFAAPFVVGGASEDPSWLYGYFGVVTLLGLGIDTVRRWAWITVLSLIGGYATGWMLHAASGGTTAVYMLYLAGLSLAAIAVPVRRLVPDHEGPTVAETLRRSKGAPLPGFPARVAFAAVAASAVMMAEVRLAGAAEFWLSVLLLAGLTLALVIWARRAEALEDIAVLPAGALLWVVFDQGASNGEVYRRFAATYAETVEADYPMVVTLLVAIGALVTVAAAWRSFRATRWPAVWAGAAALFAPATAILIELGWTPAAVIGAYPWALHAAVLAALMVGLAERYARADGETRLRMALAVLSALSCLAFAFVIVLSSAALTVALAVTVSVAAALDRQFRLPPMAWFIAAGVVTLGFRLVVDPGIGWGQRAPLPEVVLAYGGTLAAFLAGLWLLRPLERPTAKLMLDSAAWSTGGLFLSLLLYRWLDSLADARAVESHWSLGLAAVIWLGLAFAQVQRLAAGGRLRQVRLGLGAIFGLIGASALFAAVTEANPLLRISAAPVMGPPVINTLVVAYLLPAVVIGLAAWRVRDMNARLRQACGALVLVLCSLWLGLAIRHFWQGAAGMHESNGVTQPELYTYTITLLILGAVLFYQSLARASDVMRKAGLAVIGLAVAKVFLIDIAGLGGLIRVFSLLALGLALAGLAWLNRWALLRAGPAGQQPLDQ